MSVRVLLLLAQVKERTFVVPVFAWWVRGLHVRWTCSFLPLQCLISFGFDVKSKFKLWFDFVGSSKPGRSRQEWPVVIFRRSVLKQCREIHSNHEFHRLFVCVVGDLRAIHSRQRGERKRDTWRLPFLPNTLFNSKSGFFLSSVSSYL